MIGLVNCHHFGLRAMNRSAVRVAKVQRRRARHPDIDVLRTKAAEHIRRFLPVPMYHSEIRAAEAALFDKATRTDLEYLVRATSVLFELNHSTREIYIIVMVGKGTRVFRAPITGPLPPMQPGAVRPPMPSGTRYAS